MSKSEDSLPQTRAFSDDSRPTSPTFEDPDKLDEIKESIISFVNDWSNEESDKNKLEEAVLLVYEMTNQSREDAKKNLDEALSNKIFSSKDDLRYVTLDSVSKYCTADLGEAETDEVLKTKIRDYFRNGINNFLFESYPTIYTKCERKRGREEESETSRSTSRDSTPTPPATPTPQNASTLAPSLGMHRK